MSGPTRAMPDEFQYDVFLTHNAQDKPRVRRLVPPSQCSTFNCPHEAGKPNADPFDLLCHLAFDAPVLTRPQRADHVTKQQAAFFGYFAPEAREILGELLEKYATDGELQFTLPDVLKVPPISQHGNVNEIIGKFGGADELRNAVNRLQLPPYAC